MGLLHRAVRRLCLIARESPAIASRINWIFQIWYDLPFPPTHYYSPLPDVRSLKKDRSRWYKEDTSPAIDWNLLGQLEFARSLAPYASEAAALPSFTQIAEEGYGKGYGEVEAHLLYLILRELKPGRVIEVGSGVSTFFTLAALAENRARDGVASSLTCIEPYPYEKLQTLVRENQVRLEACEVQDISLKAFEELSDNDVLFIDSSHVSKRDSDVDFLILEVLPRLRKNVVVHIHDIPYPMSSIPSDHPLFETYLFWNEWALVKAFLSFNAAFRIEMCQSYLHGKEPDAMKALVPLYEPNRHFPASLWLRKTG